jgi:hypothetical protein
MTGRLCGRRRSLPTGVRSSGSYLPVTGVVWSWDPVSRSRGCSPALGEGGFLREMIRGGPFNNCFSRTSLSCQSGPVWSPDCLYGGSFFGITCKNRYTFAQVFRISVQIRFNTNRTNLRPGNKTLMYAFGWQKSGRIGLS